LQCEHFTPLLWSHGNPVGYRMTQQLIHWPIIFGIASEVAILGITHQQSLALQITGDTVSDGVR